MPTTDDLINTSYQEKFEDTQANEEYDEWLEKEDERRKALAAERKRIFHLYCRTAEEIESDPDYTDDF